MEARSLRNPGIQVLLGFAWIGNGVVVMDDILPPLVSPRLVSATEIAPQVSHEVQDAKIEQRVLLMLRSIGLRSPEKDEQCVLSYCVIGVVNNN